MINPTGGTPFQITDNNTLDSWPSYSPDGRKLAYAGLVGTNTEIYTINATGGTPFQVTNNDTADHEPSYSPDGQRIALSRWDGTDFEIYTVNATGGGSSKSPITICKTTRPTARR